MTVKLPSLTGRTRIVSVWGHPVAHSLSPPMHNAALRELGLDWVYVPFDVAAESVPEALGGLRALGMVGANVTVGLKEAVFRGCDEVAPDAARVGSVNTVQNVGGRLIGWSTDGGGFLKSLEAVGQGTAGRNALILGAGGSARAVAFALADSGGKVTLSNRTRARAEQLAEDINRYLSGSTRVIEWGQDDPRADLLVNTTSVGMHPDEDAVPAIGDAVFSRRPFVCDLIYRPRETVLLRNARAAGCETLNGVKMLVYQGALSLSIWSGIPFAELPLATMEAVVSEALREDKSK